MTHHAGFVGQPFSQAAFDAHDTAMTGLITQEPSAGTVAPAEPYADTWKEDGEQTTYSDDPYDDDLDDPYGPPDRNWIT